MRKPDQNQRATKQAFIDKIKGFLDGWMDNFGVSNTDSTMVRLVRLTDELTPPLSVDPYVLRRTLDLASQLDVDHPVNVVEGKNVIVLQVSSLLAKMLVYGRPRLTPTLTLSIRCLPLARSRRTASSRPARRTSRTTSSSADSTTTTRLSRSTR